MTWNHFYKSGSLAQAGGRPGLLTYQGTMAGRTTTLSQDLLTWRGLKDGLNGKGTVDLFVGQMDLRDYLILKVLPQLGGWI